MEFISVQEALKKKSGRVSLRGWVHRERGSNEFKFIVLRDATDIIQCVVKKESVSAMEWEAADKLLIESAIEVEGSLKEDKRAPNGFEVQASRIKVIDLAEEFPIHKDQSPELLLDNRHLWIRSRKLTSVMKVRSTVLQAFRDFYLDNGYYEFPPPILQPTQCEGGSTLFEVKYYDRKTFLSQSWQLYAEATIFSLEKIFCISPCFRAERSKTSRHLSEFMMAEMEAAWMELPGLLKSAEECVYFIIKTVIEKNKKELQILGRDIEKLENIKLPFPRITYTEALEILKEKENMNVSWSKDLRTIEEDRLMKHFSTPLIVTNYPKEVMAFYKPEDPKNPRTCLCFDMLAPEGYGEIIGGSQRSLDVKDMIERLKKEKEDPKKYDWYFDLRRYGSVPHSGYGLGVERVVAWVCGLDNIKDAIGFPRTMLRWKP